MKKNLFLTTLPLMVFLSAFAGGFQIEQTAFSATFTDSIIKDTPLAPIREVPVVNPRAGFKDLFESSPSTNNYNVKLNPLAVSFVQDYMGSHTGKLTKMKSWGKPYFDMMDDILTKYGLPDELKYLSVIESDLKSSAVSWAGAVGPWQFMPETGRMMGLRITKYSDERTDFHKSTHAAARYLTHLYSLYNDWLLVIAAYNGGPGAVNSAIRRSGSRNFWSLQHYLPAESRMHVKKFIATHYIMEGTGGQTTLTKSERALQVIPVQPQAMPDEAEVIMVTGRYNSVAIVQHLQMGLAEFNVLNPGFDKQLALTGSYALQLPKDKVLLFRASKPQILEQSIRMMLATATRTF
ncbi:MAG TPA: lytic transglycosylase domain-containing protein [Flavisolibacter sp.]|nr:lytic transglycosylase domain-containing protein [Flavisolibacter sp.]